MNKWKIAGNDNFYRIIKTDLSTRISSSVDAQHPMKLVNALSYVMGEAHMGDMIVLPDGTPLSVGFTPRETV